uniref:Copia protein n=1 Tax=Cajanus cajan TaxID=3821 RepID=A0A151SEF1_CAJCA|nr:hypothetical protein KK1_024988 [Cajanus cajan]
MDCHFVRDEIQVGNIVISYTHQLADIFTKTLVKSQFQLLLCKLGIRDLHALT